MATRDLIVWNSVIGAFAQNSDGDEALNLFKRMKRCGFMADQATNQQSGVVKLLGSGCLLPVWDSKVAL
ncbi:pentatricopeptide repeat (PPR) superfamily protein [Artemisia annua]|uniref:Pentatricopeptide repeat (PPR) superfamily protein n=1 Tax=Artemisia annua TaxID=35608 RepID=A0A2U1MAQ8_ARTAN|nr:pentatricopeptide repeat (PPR) superfamily protein [Artemisia annua]